MDVDAFLRAADELFDRGPHGHLIPRSPAYAEVSSRVEGMTTANELAVLNLAASLLPADEDYLEVGSFKGRSMVGATLGVSGPIFHAVENYVEFGMQGADARATLDRHLAEHAAHADVRLVEGDGFAVLSTAPYPRDIGVYFYDGEHTSLAHYLALGVAEPLLADEALVLIDDATWPLVARAHQAYLRRHPGWEIVRRWDSTGNDDPHWANGLHALRFRRPAGAPRRLHPDVRAALIAQRRAVGPARKAIWTIMHKAPWLVPLAKRLEPKRAHKISPEDHAT
ncbi:class I SAM-dependent methyltransferase [Nostocoides veronense]